VLHDVDRSTVSNAVRQIRPPLAGATESDRDPDNGGMTNRIKPAYREDPFMPSRLDFAWHCHAAQENWTARIDTKASILLTVNLVGFAALLSTRSPSSGAFHVVHGWHRLGVDAGIVLVGLAALASVVVVVPLLGSRRPPVNQDVIYFGHVRHRSPGTVARQIASLTAEERIDQVSRQLVVMARANWVKYRTFQLALLASIAGYVFASLALTM
jgi:hypothetical protein